MKKEWKPWEWYPDIWATESKFWTWLRGSFRKAVWNRSPIKITFKNSVCHAPPEDYTGRAKSGAYCALTGEWEGKSKLEIDHLSGNVSLREEKDILGFIQHLIPPPNSLQPVKKEAHKIKSYAERMGITYEEAVISKKVIAFSKLPVAQQKKTLIDWGFDEDQITNTKSRKQCYIHIARSEDK